MGLGFLGVVFLVYWVFDCVFMMDGFLDWIFIMAGYFENSYWGLEILSCSVFNFGSQVLMGAGR